MNRVLLFPNPFIFYSPRVNAFRKGMPYLRYSKFIHLLLAQNPFPLQMRISSIVVSVTFLFLLNDFNPEAYLIPQPGHDTLSTSFGTLSAFGALFGIIVIGISASPKDATSTRTWNRSPHALSKSCWACSLIVRRNRKDVRWLLASDDISRRLVASSRNPSRR